MPSLRAAEHHRVDAALSQPGGVALHAGVFRRNATRWRDEPLHRGLKVIQARADHRKLTAGNDKPLLVHNTNAARGGIFHLNDHALKTRVTHGRRSRSGAAFLAV